ncbi:uncharacterized protein LOC111132979 isoform X1 [Crassostrea virginica]
MTRNTVVFVCLLFVWLSTVQTAIITVFEVRRRCPSTAEAWLKRKGAYICSAPAQYHCMPTQNGDVVEFCEDSIWIEDDYCPRFNTNTGSIDVHLCPVDSSCPRQHYLSSTVYKYPDCLQSHKPVTNSPKAAFLNGGASNTSTSRVVVHSLEPKTGTVDPSTILLLTVLNQTGVLLVLVVLVALLIYLIYVQHKNRYISQIEENYKKGIIDRVISLMKHDYICPEEMDHKEAPTNVLEDKYTKEEVETNQRLRG